jgi:hypothetical protein
VMRQWASDEALGEVRRVRRVMRQPWPDRRDGGKARSLLGVIVAALACALLAGCGSSSAPPSTTTTTSAQQAALQPKLLALADFPAGWTVDSSPDAASTAGTPTCLANVVKAEGAATRVHAVFVGPKSQADAAIQTVASFAPGAVSPSVASIQAGFLSCNGTTFTQGSQTARISTALLKGIPSGPAGFAAEMELSLKSQHIFVDVFFGVTGDVASVVVWRSTSSSPALFAETAAKAQARL